jgi:hypothetical protein
VKKHEMSVKMNALEAKAVAAALADYLDSQTEPTLENQALVNVRERIAAALRSYEHKMRMISSTIGANRDRLEPVKGGFIVHKAFDPLTGEPREID